MDNFIYLSKERIKELETELRDLKKSGRKEMAEMIAEARAHGDLSENAEYDAAKDKQGMLELRINKLEELLSKASVVDTSQFAKDKVHILAKVKVKNLNNNKIYNYTLVSPEEADIEKGKISLTSPVGQSLMNKQIGDITQVKVPAGLMKYQILSIE